MRAGRKPDCVSGVHPDVHCQKGRHRRHAAHDSVFDGRFPRAAAIYAADALAVGLRAGGGPVSVPLAVCGHRPILLLPPQAGMAAPPCLGHSHPTGAGARAVLSPGVPLCGAGQRRAEMANLPFPRLDCGLFGTRDGIACRRAGQCAHPLYPHLGGATLRDAAQRHGTVRAVLPAGPGPGVLVLPGCLYGAQGTVVSEPLSLAGHL